MPNRLEFSTTIRTFGKLKLMHGLFDVVISGDDYAACVSLDEPLTMTAKINLTLGLAAFVLSLISFLVVSAGAQEEPYGKFIPTQALVQVGLGSILIAFWLQWTAIVVVLLTLRRVRYAWSLGILWSAMCLFYLSNCPLGYVEDIARFAVSPRPSNNAQAAEFGIHAESP